jgi:spore maturation protein CgeB
MLHRRTSDLQAIFQEDIHCGAFDDPLEASEQVKRFLRDDVTRRAIASRGQELVEGAHSWDHRAKAILDQYFTIREGSLGQHSPADRGRIPEVALAESLRR